MTSTERDADSVGMEAEGRNAPILSTLSPKGEAPFTYAYRYPVANGETCIRFDTGGREINGSRPVEAIPLYTHPSAPKAGDREAIALAIYGAATRFDGDEIGVHLSRSAMVECSTTNAADVRLVVMQMCEDAADAILAALTQGDAG